MVKLQFFIVFTVFCSFGVYAQLDISLGNEYELKKVKLNHERQLQKSDIRATITYDGTDTQKEETLMVDSLYRKRRSVAENKEIHFIKDANNIQDSTKINFEVKRQSNVRRNTQSNTKVKYSKD